MKNELPNKKFILTAFLVVLFSFSLVFAQTDQTNQQKGASVAKAIDTIFYDNEIELSAQRLKIAPRKKANKKKLAEAYAARGIALAAASQYRAALGDFRRSLRLDRNNKDAKKMHDRIIAIYQAIGRKPPEEGTEPPPLPFTKN